MTATHQLKTAVTSVAYAGRALFLASISSNPCTTEDLGSADSFTNVLLISLTNALLGMDANDPPKTLATMQLIGSIFSNVSTENSLYMFTAFETRLFLILLFVFWLQLVALDDNGDGPAFLSNICFSEWLDEFLCRLFSLLLHLEPSNVL